MNDPQTPFQRLLVFATRVALVAALLGAVWSVYRTLPLEERTLFGGSDRSSTDLRIVLRRATIGFPLEDKKISVQLYPINVTAARNEFESERRPGVRFDDFLLRLMGDRQPVSADLDERDEAVVSLPAGKWWVHATAAGAQELTWRLPVNVTGREVHVELTYDNTYLRAKKF